MLYDVGDFHGVWAPESRWGGRWWLYVDARDEAIRRNQAAGIMDDDGRIIPGALSYLPAVAKFGVHHLGHPECTCKAKGA